MIFREFIVCLILVLYRVILTGQDRPNILWITIEDTSPQFIGCYGSPDAHTPVIDRLASEGVRFTNAFSTGTVCSPSRSTIITGVPTYKMGTGHHRSSLPVPDFIRGFPYYLKQQGYYASNNAKTDYNIANEKEFVGTAWHESSNTAGWWNKKDDQPFFAVFNFAESHQSRTMSMSYDWYVKNVWEHLPEDRKFSDTDFEMPPIYHDSPEMRKQMARVYNSIALTDIRIGELLEKLEADGLRDDTMIFFFADHGEGMPRGKTNGIDYGYRVPFIIWFPDKYKYLSPWGTSGTVTEEQVNFEDLAPTMISLVGGELPPYLEGRALLGAHRSEPVNNLLLSSDRADNGPDMVRTLTDGRYTYSRNYMPFVPALRYIRYIEISDIAKQMRIDLKNDKLDSLQRSLLLDRPAEYLFDLKKDPWETENLAMSNEHQTILKKMRQGLDDRLKKARDIHFLPEYELGKIGETSTPYEFRQNETEYPFDAIYAAASLSGKRDAATFKKQRALLKNESPIVRYWAIMGLKSYSEKKLKPLKKDILNAMNNDYLPVTLLAASLSYKIFKSKIAEDKLKQFAKSDNMDLALLAVNEILYFESKSPFLETIKTIHEMPGRNYNVKAACMDYLGLMGRVENVSHNEE